MGPSKKKSRSKRPAARKAKVRKTSRPKKAASAEPKEGLVYSDVRRELQASLLRRLL